MTDPKMANDGFSNAGPLTEGYLRKGGLNPPSSLALQRPPPPAPMRAAEAPPSGPKPPSGK